jgi:hypothetical protein
VRIREADGEERRAIAREAADDLADGQKVFVVESGSFTGFVIADVMSASEDDGEYSDPSPLLVD